MDGFITIGTKLDTKQFDVEIAELEQEIRRLEGSITMGKSMGKDVSSFNKELDVLKRQLEEVRREKENLNKPNGLGNLKKSANDLGSSLQSAIKKASRLVLSIFGIRSAYLALRRASSELASYNEEYASNLEYIRYALTQAVAPILEYIVNLAMKLLAYINLIAKAWFGVNLFENASVDSFKRMKQGVNGVTGAVNELKKQLAGFDEMNIIQDNGTASSGGGGGGIALPTMDLANLQDVEVPEWLQWILDNGDTVKALLVAIGAAIIGIKIGSLISGFISANTAMGGFLGSIGKMVAGAALIAGGFLLVINSISNMVTGWNEMTASEQAAQVGLLALGVALETFGLMMLGATGPVAAVIALSSALVVLLVKWEEESIRINDVEQAQNRLTDAREKATQSMKRYTQAVDRAEEAEKALIKAQDETGLSGEALFNEIQRGTRTYQQLSEEEKNVYKLYLDHIEAQQNLTSVANEAEKAIQDEKDAFWLSRLATEGGIDALEDWKKEVEEATKTGNLNVEDAARIFSKAMSDMNDSTQEAFLEGIEPAIKDAIDPSVYQNPLHWMELNFFDTFRTISGYATNILGWIFNLPRFFCKFCRASNRKFSGCKNTWTSKRCNSI